MTAHLVFAKNTKQLENPACSPNLSIWTKPLFYNIPPHYNKQVNKYRIKIVKMKRIFLSVWIYSVVCYTDL